MDGLLSDGSATYTDAVSQRRGSSTTYAMANWRGDAVRQTNGGGGTDSYRIYDAFGNRLLARYSPVGPFGYAASSGYQEDGDSGLRLLGHRYYDPTTGRFLTRDPAKDGRNWYAYVDGNPLRSVDPTGLNGTNGLRSGAVRNQTSKPIRVLFDVGDEKHRHPYQVILPPGYQTTGIDADYVEPEDGSWYHVMGMLTADIAYANGYYYLINTNSVYHGDYPPGFQPDPKAGRPSPPPFYPHPTGDGGRRPVIEPIPPGYRNPKSPQRIGR